MGWLRLEGDGSGGADSSPWYHGGEVVKKQEPKTWGISWTKPDGAQGKESQEAELLAAHSGCGQFQSQGSTTVISLI